MEDYDISSIQGQASVQALQAGQGLPTPDQISSFILVRHLRYDIVKCKQSTIGKIENKMYILQNDRFLFFVILLFFFDLLLYMLQKFLERHSRFRPILAKVHNHFIPVSTVLSGQMHNIMCCYSITVIQ